jgi:hypothetical protein
MADARPNRRKQPEHVLQYVTQVRLGERQRRWLLMRREETGASISDQLRTLIDAEIAAALESADEERRQLLRIVLDLADLVTGEEHDAPLSLQALERDR